MKTYLEIKVPIKYDDPWFKELRSLFADIPVRWQKDFYHITMAFVNDTPKGIDICPMLKGHLAGVVAPVLTFDLLDVFSTGSGMFIFHLSASQVPEDCTDGVHTCGYESNGVLDTIRFHAARHPGQIEGFQHPSPHTQENDKILTVTPVHLDFGRRGLQGVPGQHNL